LFHPRLTDEGATALLTPKIALVRQLFESFANGDFADAVAGSEIVLGRQTLLRPPRSVLNLLLEEQPELVI
jgi:hypothetical protein